ncbi:hypothetical protein NIES4102_35580 [Chondrocystis sp. NIES-4102]|nr:hypothetical protein NIES4102_35580 [Chondrocystis sp. NIES-4102]
MKANQPFFNITIFQSYPINFSYFGAIFNIIVKSLLKKLK